MASDCESQSDSSRGSFELSSSTLDLLKQFQLEEENAKASLARIENQDSRLPQDMSVFKEDWQLSQFWYSAETANILAQEVLRSSGKNARIGFLSSPTAFVEFQSMLDKMTLEQVDGRDPFLFEFDKRFHVFGSQFIHYDYRAPLTRLSHLQSSFDFLILDPPFLSEECWYKSSETAKYLLKPGNSGKYLICTGMIMKEQIRRELNCFSTLFKPAHAKGRLSNQFGAFINYTSTSPLFQIEFDKEDTIGSDSENQVDSVNFDGLKVKDSVTSDGLNDSKDLLEKREG